MKINGQAPAEDMTIELEMEDITSYLSTNPDYLNNVLTTDLGQKALQPKLDQHFSKSLETWKANNLDKIVNERVEALFPNETPQAKQMRELQIQIDKINAEKSKAEMANVTLNILSDMGVPNTFARFLQGQDEATTRANIADFKNYFDTALNGTVDSKFKQFGHQPQVDTQKQDTSQIDVSKMTYAERTELYNTNINEYNRLFG